MNPSLLLALVQVHLLDALKSYYTEMNQFHGDDSWSNLVMTYFYRCFSATLQHIFF